MMLAGSSPRNFYHSHYDEADLIVISTVIHLDSSLTPSLHPVQRGSSRYRKISMKSTKDAAIDPTNPISRKPPRG